jgi:hypothetical protein
MIFANGGGTAIPLPRAFTVKDYYYCRGCRFPDPQIRDLTKTVTPKVKQNSPFCFTFFNPKLTLNSRYVASLQSLRRQTKYVNLYRQLILRS